MSCLTDAELAAIAVGGARPEHLDGCADCNVRLALRTELAATVISVPRAPSEANTVLSRPAIGSDESVHDTQLSPGAPRLKPPPMVPGMRLARYQLLELLGEGGMGQVWSAYDPQLDRRIALKVVGNAHPERAGGEAMVREARVMAKLAHPNVLTVFDVGDWAGGLFIAMEVAEGGSLESWLAEKPRTWRESVAMFTEVGRGLAAAHASGVVHRDFKPANVVVTRDGRPRVTDFGLARVETETSAPGRVMGTLGYISPEQLKGLPADGRSDQFSFCVALYEALCGRAPFQGNTWATREKAVLSGQPLPPPPETRAPDYVMRAVMKGLTRDPDGRFPSMEALLTALNHDPMRRWRRLRSLGAAALVVALGGGLAVRAVVRERTRCDRQAAAAMQIWSPERRAAIEAAFLRASPQWGPVVFGRIAPRLDAYVKGWTEDEVRACKESGDREAHAALRLDCLDRRRESLSALLQMLADGQPDDLRRAAHPVQRLQSVDSCAAIGRAPSGAAADPGPELRALLARVGTLYAAGKYTVALPLAHQALDEARAQGATEAQAEALYRIGDMDCFGATGEALKRSDAELVEAAEIADRAGSDEIRAGALMRRLRTQPPGVAPEAYLAIYRAAAAAVARSGNPPHLLWELEGEVSDQLVNTADQKDAAEFGQRSLRHALDAFGPDAVQTAWAYLSVAATEEPPRGLELEQHAVRILQQVYGPDDAISNPALDSLAWDLAVAGRGEEALVAMAQVAHNCALSDDPADRAPLVLLEHTRVRAAILERMRRWEESLRAAEDGLASLPDAKTGDPLSYSSASMTAAHAELELGRPAQARARLEDVAGLETYPEERGDLELLMARALLALGRRGEARPFAERAKGLIPKPRAVQRFQPADVAALLAELDRRP